MNEGDFDKSISKKLKDDNNQYPDMDKNWKKVVEKMVEAQPSKPTAGGIAVLPNGNNGQKSPILPWLLSALILLLGVNSWLFWRLLQSNEAQKGIIDTRLKPQTTHIYDTIYQTKVIYQTDTIYKKVVIISPFLSQNKQQIGGNQREMAQLAASISPSLSTPNFDVKQPFSTHKVTSTDETSRINKDTFGKHIETYKNTAIQTTQDTKIIETDKSLVGNTAIPTKNFDFNTSASEPNINAKTTVTNTLPPAPDAKDDTAAQNPLPITQITAQSKPNTDSLIANPHKISQSNNDSLKKWAAVPYDSLEIKPQNVSNDIIKPSRKKLVIDHYGIGLQGGFSQILPTLKGVNAGNWVGLTSEVAFNKRLRLSISSDFMSLHYKSLTRNPLLEHPNDPQMTENYNLKYIEGKTPSYLASIGAAYFLKPKSKFNPFLMVGYQRRWILPHTVEFEFTNKLTGEEKAFYVTRASHQDNWFSLGAGVETQLFSKVYGQLKAEYIYDNNHGNSSLSNILLRGGIFYRF